MTRSLVRMVAVGAAAALLLSACAGSDRTNPTEAKAGDGPTGGTMIFGAAGAPKLFDPFYATDGVTFRVARQQFEGLVGFKPGTAEVVPSLAKKYSSSSDGLTWTFELQDGV